MDVKLNFVNRIGPVRASQKYPRDILLQFVQWSIKTKVIQCFREQPEIAIQGSQISIYSDLEKFKNFNCRPTEEKY